MAIEQQILSEISRSVDRVSSSSESFRTTANQQNNNIQKIVKDISSMFRAQSASAGEMASSIDELQNEMSQTNDKTDAVASRLNDTIGIQSSMLGELKGIGQGIDNLSNMIMMMLQNGGGGGGFGGGGSGGTSGSPISGGGRLGAAILKVLGLTAVGAAGGVAIGMANNANNENNQTGAQPQEAATAGILAAIKQKETGGEADPYTAIARGADNKPLPLGPDTGTGAYQFTPDTWKEAAAAANIDVSQYPQARDAPPELQDRVAKERAAYLLKKAKGDASLIPAYWRGGENIDVNNMSPTVTAYQQDVMNNAVAQQPTANSSPGTSNDYAKFLMDRAQRGVDAEKLNSSFASKLMKAIQEAEQATGQKVQITSGVRSAEQQAQLYANYKGQTYIYNGKPYYPNPNEPRPLMAAEPGRSAHETGNAVDLQSGPARDYIMKNAAKFGLQDLPGDPPHISDIKENASPIDRAALAVQNSIGAVQGAGAAAAAGIMSPVEKTPTASLMEGLGMPAGMGPASEPMPSGIGDMSSYNPLGILGALSGGNMFGPSGQMGAAGAAISVLGAAANQFEPSTSDNRGARLNQAAVQDRTETAAPWVNPDAPQEQPMQQQSAPQQQSSPKEVSQDTYNHPSDRNVSPSWSDRILGLFPNETSGVNQTWMD